MVFPAFTSVSRYTHLRQDNVGEEVSRYLLESSAQRLLLDMIFSLKTKNTTMASGKMRIDSMGRLLLETIEQGLATRIGRVPQGHSNGKRYCAETDINPYFGIDVHSFTDISRITLWFSAQINSSFSRDRGPHELFCTSLCACRCPGASDPGPGRGHGPSHGHARHARADRSSSQRSSGLLRSVERPRLRQHTADASNSLHASDNDPPRDTNSPRPTQTRHLPDVGLAGERQLLEVQAVRRSGFRLKPGQMLRVRWQTVWLRAALLPSTFCNCFSCFCPSQRQLTERCACSADYVSTGAKKALHGQKVSSVRTICVLFRHEIQHGEDRMAVGPERSSKNRFLYWEK